MMALRVHAYVHRFFRWCVGRDIIEVESGDGSAEASERDEA